MKIAIACGLAIIALFVAGCGGVGYDSTGNSYSMKVRHANVDGRDVPCVVLITGHGSVSVDCDWGKA